MFQLFSGCNGAALLMSVTLTANCPNPARDSYGSPASREPSSANRGQGLPLIDSSV